MSRRTTFKLAQRAVPTVPRVQAIKQKQVFAISRAEAIVWNVRLAPHCGITNPANHVAL